MLFAPLLTPGKLSLARGCASFAAPEAARLGTRAALIHSASVAPALRYQNLKQSLWKKIQKKN